MCVWVCVDWCHVNVKSRFINPVYKFTHIRPVNLSAANDSAVDMHRCLCNTTSYHYFSFEILLKSWKLFVSSSQERHEFCLSFWIYWISSADVMAIINFTIQVILQKWNDLAASKEILMFTSDRVLWPNHRVMHDEKNRT